MVGIYTPLNMLLSVQPRLTSRVPAGWRRSWRRGEAARAQDEESVVVDQGEASGRLWDMPGLPEARQGAGGAGTIALEADGAHEREARVSDMLIGHRSDIDPRYVGL